MLKIECSKNLKSKHVTLAFHTVN